MLKDSRHSTPQETTVLQGLQALSSLEAEQDEAALSLGRKIVFLMPLEL
jgi:hypothetical protein